MKMKLVTMLMVTALIVTISGTSQAISLQPEAGIIKTWDYEVGTSYSGGLEGKFYFRTAATSYYTEEHGLVTYDALNPDHRLFTGNANAADDLIITKDASLKAGEDTWGLLRITSIFTGDVTALDSRFGDSSNATPIGNDITANTQYWSESIDDKSLLGMLWGNQDQVVEVIDLADNEYRIWSSGGEFDIFEVTGDVPYNPAISAAHSPAARPVAPDEFPGWFDRNTDRLVWGGDLDYFRFQGNATSLVNFDGETEVLLSFIRGDWAPLMQDWWTPPSIVPQVGSGYVDMWQSWNIGDPFVFSNGWAGSEDSGRFYVVPEPVTMLGMFLGIGGLANYLRKRQKALSLA